VKADREFCYSIQNGVLIAARVQWDGQRAMCEGTQSLGMRAK